ncbi:MAG TPA: cytochrome c3 family protein [Chthoniobacteraceae bacterium]|nr:cytochrome c3 family protein [Chthoniobacteraceae bacterium]
MSGDRGSSKAAKSGSILDSPHNLGVSGPGVFRAKSQTDVCIFCHSPHGGESNTPLWNHRKSAASYTTYSSSTMVAKVGQPNGSSALCLSCHDGTIALGMVNSTAKPIEMRNSAVAITGSANLGTDLSQDHPVSFTYNSALAARQGKLADPGKLKGPVRLDANHEVQCTSCHDPHNDQYGDFLVMDNSGSQLCTTCHIDAAWSNASHHLSGAPIKGAAAKQVIGTTVKSVGENSCKDCHAPHLAAGRQQLLLTSRQEDTCFACHNGTVVRQNLEPEFNKPSVHPVMLSTASVAQRGVGRSSLLGASGRVTCSDCHDSHEANSKIEAAPRASGFNLGASGVSRAGTAVPSITYEYELCFKCHGDSPARSADAVNRISPQPNLRLAFNTANDSFHPVEGVGRNSHVPSLLPPYTAGSIIKCTDCHNNDQGPGAGGTGPRGPHGSDYVPLLERQLVTTDYTGESIANDALCYKCHSRDSILSDQSFRAYNELGQESGHRFHIVDQKAACTTCHDSHGVATNKHLINFNPVYVTPGSSGRIQYVSTGLFMGTCTLTCHGYDHEQAAYPNLTIHPVSAVKAPARKIPTAAATRGRPIF